MKADFAYATHRVVRTASAETQNKRCGESHGKEAEMAYKKPEIVAKSAAKQSFVAGCPTNTYYMCCTSSGSGTGTKCEIRRLK